MPVQSTHIIDTPNLSVHAALLKSLCAVPVSDALGVALSFVLQCAYDHPAALRRCLSDPVVREGFRGESLITLLTRVARS